jgi:predicted GNAT family acetyltransferase
MSTLTFEHHLERRRYEAFAGGVMVGYAIYKLLGDSIVITHTEVLPEHEGRGIGSYIAREALADARAQGKFVVPACSFIAAYLREHREDADLVKPEVQAAYRIRA